MNGKLHKSRTDKMVLGVCGGIAEHFEIDSSIIRIIWTVASFMYGTGLILYFVAAFILPYNDEEVEPKKFETDPKVKAEQKNVIGIILIITGAFFLLRNFSIFFDVNFLWPGLLIVIGIFLIIKGRENKNEE